MRIRTDSLAECNSHLCKAHLLAFYVSGLHVHRSNVNDQWRKFCRRADPDEYKLWEQLMDVYDDYIKCRYYLSAALDLSDRKRKIKWPRNLMRGPK